MPQTTPKRQQAITIVVDYLLRRLRASRPDLWQETLKRLKQDEENMRRQYE